MKKKRRRKIKIGRVIILLIPVLIILLLFIGGIKYILNIFNDKNINACKYDVNQNIEFSLDLNSTNYLLSRENENGNYVIYAKNEKEKIYPASLTKVMTMYVVLNNIDENQINDMITVSYNDLEGLIEANASVVGLNVNDNISIKDALYGLILPSGADCANLLRRIVEEKDLDFIDEMNRLAKEIGMNDTHFSNVTGLHDENNYTTLYDMNILMHEIFKYDVAKEILTTMVYSHDGYEFISTMKRYSNNFSSDEATILGGKTGFTLESHLNLVTVIDTKYGITFLLLANADENGEDKMGAHVMDALNIIEYYY